MITRAHVLTGNWQALYDEVRAIREACGDAHMKTILATGELGTLRNVARASLVCMMAGADFIKTSTGKEGVNATLPVGLVMVRAIREYHERTGYMVGFKPAGGIRTAKEALDWLALMKEELGDRWLRPDLFRFGASSPAHRHRAPARALRHRPLLGRAPPSRSWITRAPARTECSSNDVHRRDLRDDGRTAPRPKRRRRRTRGWTQHERRFGLFIGGAWTGARRRDASRRSTRPTGKPLARLAQAGAADVDRAVARPRAAQPAWWALGGHGRARYLYALARQSRSTAGCFAVLETLDNGKPIREIARHRRAAGRPPLLPPRRLGPAHGRGAPRLRAGRRRRPDHPVELPAADAGLEDRAGAGDGQHGGAQAGRVHARSPRCASPRSASEIGLPAGRRQHRHRRRPDRRGARRPPRTSTRSPSPARPRSAASSATRRPGSGKKLSLELGGKSPFIVFDDADLDSVVEGVVDAIWFNQGQVCCAGSRLLVQEGVAERLRDQAAARAWRRCASAIRSTRPSTSARSSPRCSCRRSRTWSQQGRDEGATLWQPSWSCPTRGLVLPADPVHRRGAGRDDRAGGDLRAGAGADDLPHAGRGGGAGQQHPLRPGRQRLDREHQPGARRRAQDQGRHGLDQLHQPVRRGERLRRLPRERVRARRRAGGAVGVCEVGGGGDGRTGARAHGTAVECAVRAWGREEVSRPCARAPSAGPPLPPIDRTPKLYIGGKQARPDSGYSLPVLDAAGRQVGEVGEGNRKDMRNAVEAARGRRAGGPGRRRTTAPRSCTTWPRTWRPGPRSSPADRRADRRCARCRAGGRHRDRAALHLRGLGRQVRRPGPSHAAIANVTLAMPEPIGVLGHRLPRVTVRCSASSRWCCPPSPWATRSSPSPRRRAAAPPPTSTRCSTPRDVPAGVVNIVTGCASELAQVLAEHDDVDAIWYFGSAEGGERGRAALRGQHEADLGERTAIRATGSTRPGARGRSSCAGDPGQEHLGPVRGIRAADGAGCLAPPPRQRRGAAEEARELLAARGATAIFFFFFWPCSVYVLGSVGVAPHTRGAAARQRSAPALSRTGAARGQLADRVLRRRAD